MRMPTEIIITFVLVLVLAVVLIFAFVTIGKTIDSDNAVITSYQNSITELEIALGDCETTLDSYRMDALYTEDADALH